MSKMAEERALKAYPPTYTTVKRYAKRAQSELVDTHKPVRAIFQHGYEQAEKDLALTVEDIKSIVQIADDLLDDPQARVAFQNHNEEYYYRKVLEQYNNSGDEANSED